MIAKLLISALVQMLNSKCFEHIYWIAGGVDNDQDFQYLTRYEYIYIYILKKRKTCLLVNQRRNCMNIWNTYKYYSIVSSLQDALIIKLSIRYW